MKIYDAFLCGYSQITVMCLLPTLSIFSMQNVHSIQHCFIKQILFTFLDPLTLIFYCTLIAANVRDFKGNSFFFEKLLFLTLTSSISKGSYGIALKFSAKQINLIRKKSVSVICKAININVDFRIFVNASHSLL